MASRYSLEPVGSKAPAFAGEAKISLLARKANAEVSLPCNAQGHPPPVSRADGKQSARIYRRQPVGSKAPAFTGDVKGVWMEKSRASNVVLPCPAQGYPVPSFRMDPKRYQETKLSHTLGNLFISEPSGRTAPKTTGDGLNKYRGVEGESLALACAAQGFPAPITRWYKFIEGTSRRQPVQLNERVRQVSGTLIIREARVEDSGKYLCIVNNSVGGESVETVLTVTAPLIAEIEPSTQTIDFGRPATFTCTVQGNPIKTISWLKDGKPLGLEDRVLRIESVKKEDKGMYQCFVRNDQESAQATAELKLGGRFEPPQIRQAFAEETLQPGPSMFLKCVASGNPTPEITWELDGKRLSNTERLQVGQYVTVNGDVVSHLNISSIHTNDGGLYKCIAASKVGAAEHSARLNVYGLPFIRHMDKKAIVAGETLRVTCPVAGYPIESIVWERDTRVLPINRKQKVFLNGTLIIENVERMSDQATYTCVARNAQGYSARGTLEVQVMVPPIVQEFAFTKLPMNAGEFANLQCIVSSGDLPLNIRWSYPGEEMGGSSGVLAKKVADRVSMLMISVITARHTGEYVCTAENAAGTASHSTVLTVNVAPEIMPFVIGEEPANWGDTITVTCTVLKGDHPIQIEWAHNGEPISRDHPDISIVSTSKRVSLLTIDAVTARHAGEYTCTASNVAGGTSSSASLAVNVAPHIGPFAISDGPANWGDMVSATCSIMKGDFPVKIVWTFNGKPISLHDSDITITNINKHMSALSIESVAARHAGEYTCVATNRAGNVSHSTILVVNVAPQIAPFSISDEPANWGEAVSSVCTVVKGDLPIEVAWALNGEAITKENYGDISISSTSKRVSLMTIEAVSPRHAGEYTCTASNAAGATSYSATLAVNGTGYLDETVLLSSLAPQIAPFSISEEPANWGEQVSAMCSILKGDLPIEIRWSLNGEIITRLNHPDVIITNTGKKTSVLTIESVTARHAGEYSCVASNLVGSVSRSAVLSVNVPPRWILEPTDKAFAQGSDARVECKADGFPKPQVTWKRAAGDTPGDYTDLKLSNPDISVEDGTLSINNIQKTNEGYYLCEAVNGIGSGLSAVILISVQAPPQFEIKLRNQTARRGEPAVLQCEAQGEKPIGILWNMNNKRLDTKSDPRYTIREEILANGVLSDLSIKRTERSDSALFTCVATNAFGSDDTSINMIVQEVPEIPYGLKVLDKSGRSVQLSWAAPYDGNSPIKRYVIEYKISKGSWETDIDRVLVPGSQQNVAGVYNLRPATTYHLRIVAENEIGTSDPSDTVTIITAEEAPTGPPTSIKVDALDQHTLKVTWKPPPREDWNGEILGYYVGYRQSSDKPYMFETVDFSKEDIKEHHLQIANLKTYTQYGVVVQAFNKVGSGPMSEERRQHTAEGVPEQPPHDTTCTTLTSQTIRVSWVSPPLSAANGVITGYKVIYGPSDTWYDENTKDTKITSSSETILHGLKKYTNYSMQVLAFTSGGDGVKSAPIHCQTEQDAPEAPIAIKALVMSSESILISWRPPSQPNGVISQYTVYTKADNTEEPTSQKVPPNQLTHEASGLDKQQRYEFWVTASTNIGEGEASKIVTLGPSVRVPAKIASFDDKFTATYKEDVKLPCLTVGVPAPEVTWKVRGANLQTTERLKQLPEGSLFIKEVDRADAGEYSCYVENSFGHDTVTHQLVVHAPPHSPQVTLTATTTNSLTMKLRPHPTDNAPIHGYTIHYKPEFGDWETVQISSTAQKYTLENLWCGSRYQIYVTAYNGIGIGDPSDILNTRTKGSKPIIPEASKFIEVSTNSISLHLSTWSDGGCPMLYFVVEHKKKHMFSSECNFVVLDLDPASWYHLRVTAHNNAGFAVAEYEFATLTVTGGTIAPARELPDVNGGSNDEDPMKIFMANLNLVVPVVAAILVIIVAVIVICVLRGKGHSSDKGTIAPPIRNGGNDNTADVRRYFPWLPSWLDVNVVVPVGATVVVIIVGIVVICVALSRRTRGPEQTRLRDDVVYQQTGVGGATLDKRRSDLRDELGYIAPPNRKLPPVPGSNYNTCDRIKRGGTGSLRSHSTWDPRRHMYEELSHYAPNRRCPPPPPRMGSADGLSHRGMEDEICPYATFHLLGFREEMDPSKAMQFQTFPHPGNGHSGTMGPPVGHPTNASAHSRSGSQSMPRQNGRYSRVPSQGGGSGTHNVFSPEYDDPANCAPEEDQYGSQYGQYGAPYDHYGSRGSVGRRSVGSARNLPISGSPEPPPPPPRNHQDQNNSSFNDSKESNEISEAECDRDQLVNRNYGVNARGKDGMTTEEMRKLIERSVERE
ncbi:Down syndrome cell adhesion molecule-like protein [Acromyrmex echinatior]|uniref:Down syndrome cell adhesion molecule-like protein n=1 Tax=Acromyrmex echinatior TaxID=103372 RepID=F4WW39_ACREC|nr:Down syndrome cell adhesion molecule-like protein [Acromyrmex echinatior]